MTSRQYELDDLIYLMQRLRKPETGCPWDLKQDYLSITPSTIEEAYEVVDAIEQKNFPHLKEELGDLLFQVIFYGQLASEEQRFNFHDIVHELTSKLVRRHPHVFPDGTLESERMMDNALDDEGVKASWESIKQEERKSKGNRGVFDDVPTGLPALTRATKLQKRAAKLGFDWERTTDVLSKLEEEVRELKAAFAEGTDTSIESELGDVLFSCVNLARHLGKDPEAIARMANHKFESRFRHVESEMRAAGRDLYSIQELDEFWEEAKAKE